MGTGTLIVLAFVVAFVVILLWVIGLFNGIKRKDIAANGAWSDIDVQLKRRHNLVPNLVNTVKGYASHERETLEAVIQARSGCVEAKGVAAQAEAENMLTATLGRLFALSEAYPDLKANQNFMQLQEELTSTENKIGFSRQHYNRSAGQYNEAIAVFPGVLIASFFRFGAKEFYEIKDEAERQVPTVEF